MSPNYKAAESETLLIKQDKEERGDPNPRFCSVTHMRRALAASSQGGPSSSPGQWSAPTLCEGSLVTIRGAEIGVFFPL